MRSACLLLLWTVMLVPVLGLAQIEPVISYQGVLTDATGDPVPDGVYGIRFLLYDVPTGGDHLWYETQDVTCEGGLFSVQLGSVNPLELHFNETYWLELVRAGEGAMSPRIQLGVVPYAFHALYAEQSGGGSSGDDDWDISGDNVSHVPGQVAVGTPPLMARPLPARDGEESRDETTANLLAAGAENPFFAWLDEPDAASDGRTAVYGFRDRQVANQGTGVGIDQSNGAVLGHNYRGDQYSFGVRGYTWWDNVNTGGVLGAQENGDVWGALGFRDGDGQNWGVYTPDAAYVGETLVANYLQIPTGAQEDWVLTASSTAGFASWQPPTGGFTLPYDGAADDVEDVFSVTNQNTGPLATAVRGHSEGGSAGLFTAAGPSNVTSALRGEYTGTGNHDAAGVSGVSTPADNWGIGGQFTGGYKGVYAVNTATEANSDAVYVAVDGEMNGVYGYATGVRGRVMSGDGNNYGVHGTAYGAGNNYAVFGYASNGVTNYAGYFLGDTEVVGILSKGGGSFRIDHPLDPENKYLQHSFVESPDMMNVYNGNVRLDAAGEAWIEMPEWFEVLNRDFRYQLTAIGGPGPDLHIAAPMQDRRFKIAGGPANLEVSWQVTGIRQDKFANANRIEVEVDKPASERGKYLHPELYGRSVSERIGQPAPDPKER